MFALECPATAARNRSLRKFCILINDRRIIDDFAENSRFKFFPMKNPLILLLVVGIYSCSNTSSGNTPQATADSITHKPDTLNSSWINNFRNLRTAIYQDDINKIKAYFRFPVLNTNNEIWSVALADPDDTVTGVSSDTLIPFTEKDFDKYYKKLFTKEFIAGISKIKSDELFKKNETSTDMLTADSATNYSMLASINKENNTLNLILLFNTDVKDENGNDLDAGESGIGYTFVIQNDGHLIFKEIRIAG